MSGIIGKIKMADINQKLFHKRSGVADKTPTVDQLEIGEIH